MGIFWTDSQLWSSREMRHLCRWVPFPGKQAGSSPFVAPAPTGQGERKLRLGLPAKDGAGLPCHWSEAPSGYSIQSTDEWSQEN